MQKRILTQAQKDAMKERKKMQDDKYKRAVFSQIVKTGKSVIDTLGHDVKIVQELPIK